MNRLKIFLLLLPLLGSCTIAKRKYESGFYIQLNDRIHQKTKKFSPNVSRAKAQTTLPYEAQISSEVPLSRADTLTPTSTSPIEKTKELETDYTSLPNLESRMQVEADTIVNKTIGNMALTGGIALTSILLLGLPADWVFIPILLAVFGFVWLIVRAIKTAKRLAAFKKQYSEFSETEKYKKAMKLGAFNHLVIALSGLVLASIVAILIILAFSVVYI